MKKIPKIRFKGFNKEWEEKELGEIGEITTGNTPDTNNLTYYGNDFLFVSPADIETDKYIYNTKIKLSEEGFKKIRPIKKDSILFVCIGSTIGKIAKNKYECATNQQINSVITYYDYNSDFIYYVLSKNTNKIAEKAFQQAVPIINKTEFSKFKISILKSYKEQQKIGKFFNNLDNLILAQEKKYKKLENIKKALLEKLFPKDNTKIPEIRFKGFSEEWEENKLKDITLYRRGSFPQPYGLDKWYDDIKGKPFIQVFDVDDNLKLKSSTKRKISKEAMKNSVFIKKDTLIITIQGSIGRVAITQYDAYIDRTLLLFENFKISIDKTFFAFVLQQLFNIEKEKAPGGTIKTITKEVLGHFIIRLPFIQEQQKIGKLFKNLDKLLDLQKQKLEKLKQIKQAMLDKMLV